MYHSQGTVQPIAWVGAHLVPVRPDGMASEASEAGQELFPLLVSRLKFGGRTTE